MTHGRGKDCHVWHTENRCPWEKESKYNQPHDYSSSDCETKIVGNASDIELYTKNCVNGAGWNGELKTAIENGRYMIDWASFVKEPSCVHWVTLVDKQTNKFKEFFATESDVNLPVEYEKSTCDMKIFIQGYLKCYSVDTKVRCENDETSMTATIAIAVVVSVAAILTVVIVIVVLRKKSRVVREDSRQNQELNDLYGTYYQGVEYNVAIDNNPTYNEDGGNDDAVVTDENIYYQL